MSKLLRGAAVAVLALALPIGALADITNQNATLSAGQTLNLDTGAVGTSGGDLMWDGTSLNPQGSAVAFDLPMGGQSLYNLFSQSVLSQNLSIMTGSSITPSVTDVIQAHSNGGNFAKILVTAINGTSITVEFTTFGGSGGGGGGGGGPTISGVANNYSSIPAGLPNYGIAAGSLFVIYGSGFASSNNVPKNPFPLATTLNQTSVSVKAADGTIIPIGLYYLFPTQIAGVLPSGTHVGKGTITVTNGNQTSTPADIVVVDSAFGVDTVYGTGTGQGVATDANFKLISYNHSATPGQALIFWGSGVGGDTKNDDRSYPLPHQDNLTNIPMTAYIGGVQAKILYRGRSQFPGVDQVIVTVPPLAAAASAGAEDQGRATPAGIQAGCNVSVWFVSGANNTDSNFVTIPVSKDGSPCTDANSIFGGGEISSVGNGTVNIGFLGLSQTQSQTVNPITFGATTHFRRRGMLPYVAKPAPRVGQITTSNGAFGVFESISGLQIGEYASYRQASVGSCSVWQYTFTNLPPPPPYKTTGLAVGTPLVVAGSGQTATLQSVPTLKGFYSAQLSDNFITSAGGTFTFTSPIGPDVGAINTSVNLGTPIFSWLDFGTILTVNRGSGVLVKWKGGLPGSFVIVDGDSIGNGVFAGFTCIFHVEDLQGQVPGPVTSALPAGQGSLSVTNTGIPGKFTATNLNFAYDFAEVGYDEDGVNYQ
jgi:uncharacterized protein (TIGR03437 family)